MAPSQAPRWPCPQVPIIYCQIPFLDKKLLLCVWQERIIQSQKEASPGHVWGWDRGLIIYRDPRT